MLRIDVTPSSFELQYVEVPHRPFDEVFHEAILDQQATTTEQSAFVAGLAELQARRTASGAGLMQFLDQNLKEFQPVSPQRSCIWPRK